MNGVPRMIGVPTPAFEAWDVVKIPFPYTALPVQEYRPVLVIAAGRLEASHALLWAAMITSASNAAWPMDVPITDLRSAGLPAPSVVRCAKIATIENQPREKDREAAAPCRARRRRAPPRAHDRADHRPADQRLARGPKPRLHCASLISPPSGVKGWKASVFPRIRQADPGLTAPSSLPGEPK